MCDRSQILRYAAILPFIAGVLLLLNTPAWSDEPAPMPKLISEPAVELDEKIMTMIANSSEQMANLQYLSDVIGHRLTGSKQLQRANKWAAEVMEKYGLENVRLEPWEIPVGWERGHARMRVIEPDNGRNIAVASSGWTPGTRGKIVGPVVAMQVRSKEDLAQYKGKLKNAIIVRTPPQPMQPITDMTYIGRPNTPLDKGAGPSRPARRQTEDKKEVAKNEQPPAKRDGAAGKKEDAKKEEPKKDGRPTGFGGSFFGPDITDFLIAEGAAAIVSPSSKPHGLIAVSGGWRGSDRGAQQEGLARLVAAYDDYGTLWRLANDPKIKPIVELEVKNTFIPGPVVCFNTVGEIKGSEKPDEFVVIGAHLDSWDLASGTTDNGTGSTVILEAARILGSLAKQGIRPKRTIRFVLYTGEEQGLFGSREYVKRHQAEMAKTSVGLVHDTGTGWVKGYALMGRSAVRGVLEPELKSLEAVKFEGLSLQFSGGSDHQSFEAVGVPGFACVQDPDEYRLTHHTQSDTFDKAKAPNLIQGAQVMTVSAMRIANLPGLLPRDRSQSAPAPKKVDEKKEAIASEKK